MKRKLAKSLKPVQQSKESTLPTIIMTVVIVVSVFFIGLLLLRTSAVSSGFATIQTNTAATQSLDGITKGQGATLTSDGYQEIKMTADGGFSPLVFVLKKDIPVKWIIDGVDVSGCNNAVRIPSLNIYQQLKPGIQTVTFTPNASGTIQFSCGMGMIRGNFIVKDEIDLTNPTAVKIAADSIPAPKGSSCGGSGGGCGGCGARV